MIQIFFGKLHIGGFDELYKLVKKKKLDRMINRESILQYQALSTRSNSHADVLPLAIKIIIEHSNLGTYERIIVL